MSFEDQNFTSNFDNLLDMSSINHSGAFHDISDKFGFSEKERTRQQSYEQINKQVNQAKMQQVQLRRQLAMLKKSTFKDYLGRFQEQIDHLNQQNQVLRKELKEVSCKKIDDKRQRMSNRSSIRVRNSVNSVIGDENRKTNTKTNRKNVSPNMLLKKKTPNLTQSSAFLGRSHVLSPHQHKRRESQLTERKLQENPSEVISFNNSVDDKERAAELNFTGSVSKQYLKPQVQKNIFVEILQKMLKEEIVLDNQKYAQIYLESTRPQIELQKNDPVFINTLEKQIKEANSKLEMLGLVANRYQSEIEDMNINIKNVSSMFDKLNEVKGKYVEMEKRCQQLGRLRKQVKDKEQILATKKQEMDKEKDESKTITSIETLIKIFTNNPNKSFPMHHTQLYSTYYRELKQIFKINKEEQGKRQQKSVKVKELIDSIRQSRKKFNQLIQIYQGRIAKMEEKIGRILKMQQSAKSSQK